ncbi:unnamed protein product [Peniophora sp. CBMAI 1063]|nr:unnamed protein product [Peniophora sp. CBMAI 1063]
MSPPSSSALPDIATKVDDLAVYPGGAKSSAVELEYGDKAVIQHFHVSKPTGVEQFLVTEDEVVEDIPPPPPGGYKLYKRRWAGIAALFALDAVVSMGLSWFGPIADDGDHLHR